MLHFRFCHRCQYGVVQKAKERDDGSLEVRPSVFCKKIGLGLFMNSEPPEDCPYAMEHAIAMQDVEEDFAEWISGKGAKDKAEF